MHQRYYKQDPVLLRLPSAAVSALYDANIKCLEDLFGLDEYTILNIPGIGQKRFVEIMSLLTQLPFDYMDDSLPRNREQDAHAGVDPSLTNMLTDYYSEKYYKRGLNYFQQNKVGSIKRQDEETKIYQIEVYGSRPYTVTLILDADGAKSTDCTCPAFSQSYYWHENCKHIYAAALAVAEQQRLMVFENIDTGNYAYKQLMRRIEVVKPQSKAPNNEQLEYYLIRKGKQWDLYPQKIYHTLQTSNKYSNYWYHNPWEDLSPGNPKDRLIASYLKQIYSPDNYGYSNKNTGQTIGDVLELLKDRSVFFKEGKTTQLAKIKFEDEPLNLLMAINRSEETLADANTVQDGLSLHFILQNNSTEMNLNDVEIVCQDPCWVFDGTSLAQVKGSDWSRNFFLNTPHEIINIPVDEIGPFLQEFYPVLQKAKVSVRIADELTKQRVEKPIPRLYLHENARQLEIQLQFAYGSIEVPYDDQRRELLLPGQQGQTKNGQLFWSVNRDIKQEEDRVDELLESGLETNSEFRTLAPVESPLEWVTEQLPKLAENGYEIYGEQQLKRYARPKKLTSSSFSVQSRENWFELEGEITFGDITLNMRDIHSVLIKNKPYVRLQDGSTGELTKTWLNRLKQVMQLMPNEQRARIPKIAAPAIKEIGESVDDYTSDIEFEQYVNRLREFENIKQIDAPEAFNGDLRSYQLAGLSWMNFLRQYNFGGILADDMGLGKTVQVLALLQKVYKETGNHPKTLVIAPRSVIHNWQIEARNFTPDFSVYIHHGTDRIASLKDWPDATLSITTYATMRNDIKLLSSKKFDYLILDESHTIRNPSSKTSQATRKLTGGHRLCLSGTPVQNTTMDLWPQFEFINPGLLGSQTQFRDQWVKPLEKNNDQTVEEMLHKMAAPFILRRTKQKVARDLPPLTSSRVDCSMDSSQQQVYEKYRQTYYNIVNDSIDEKGVRDSRFTVLEGLMRLRQICCSPQLIEGETGNSAKLTRFMEMAEELIREGHRALVFSQFVGFLHLIEAEVKNRGWQYEYLDGQTRNRQERVNRFQSDDSKNLFLISLKAGGEGLNLTAADYVFLMDPWWNPAAERQAMDRTHRIGQDEHVFVYRFVCPGTVEEKILRLQEKKRNLAQKLVVAEAGIFKELDRDDLLALFE